MGAGGKPAYGHYADHGVSAEVLPERVCAEHARNCAPPNHASVREPLCGSGTSACHLDDERCQNGRENFDPFTECYMI